MDEEASQDFRGGQPLRLAAARKRGTTSSGTDSEATELYSDGFESSDDDYTVVMSRNAKRRLLRTSSTTSISTVQATAQRWPHTILFMAVDPSANLRRLNRQVLSAYLEGLAPNEIKDVRINSRKNILAVDVLHRSALQSLQNISEIDRVTVKSVIPTDCKGSVGVIYDVDISIPADDFPILIKPTTDDILIKHITRLGQSRCLKIVFEGDSLPPHVKVGHVRHQVRPYIPKPLQCFRCFKMGHVKGVCTSNVVCPRCAEPHSEDTCHATAFKCSNCHGAHKASSKDCPRVRNERAVLKRMVRDNSTHREAAATVRRRRRHHRRSSRNVTSADRDPSSQARRTGPPSSSSAKTDTPKTESGSRLPPREEWPSLPRTQPVSEVHRSPPTSMPSRTTDEKTTEDRQVINMLQTLMSAMRMLLSNMNTPSAQSALQVLDTLSPVLAALR